MGAFGSTHNIFVGSHSGGGTWNTAASHNNVCVGNYTMDAAMDTASNNVAVGHAALSGIQHGDDNTVVGYQAGNDITDGQGNTLIGCQAGDSITTGGTNTIIGFNVDCASGQSYAIAIGRSFTATTAENGFTVGNGSNTMFYDLDSGNITITSDRRIKENIIDSPIGLSFIEKLRPVQFNKKAPADLPEEFWNLSNLPEGSTERTSTEAGKKKITGLIAQEVKEVMDELEVDFNGWSEQEKTTKQELSYVSFIVPLIKSVQELSAKVEELEAKLK